MQSIDQIINQSLPAVASPEFGARRGTKQRK